MDREAAEVLTLISGAGEAAKRICLDNNGGSEEDINRLHEDLISLFERVEVNDHDDLEMATSLMPILSYGALLYAQGWQGRKEGAFSKEEWDRGRALVIRLFQAALTAAYYIGRSASGN